MDKVKTKQKVYGMNSKTEGEEWCAKGEAEAIGEYDRKEQHIVIEQKALHFGGLIATDMSWQCSHTRCY